MAYSTPTVLTGAQFRSIYRRLDLSVHDLSILTGAAPSTISDWGRRTSVPGSVSTLLLLFQSQPYLVRLAMSLVLQTAPYMLPPEVLKMDAVLDGVEALVHKPAEPFVHRTLPEIMAEIEAKRAGQGPGERTLPPGKTGPFD